MGPSIRFTDIKIRQQSATQRNVMQAHCNLESFLFIIRIEGWREK